MKHNVILRCYAEGSQGHWEALCLDFDLAVQGKSFDEVYRELNSMIGSYVETVSEYPEKERRRFLNRRAPFLLRLKFACLYISALMFGNRSDKERHDYTAQAACVV